MALLQINLLSRSLMRTVPVTVVLPVDKMTDFNAPLLPEKKYPTLYLLHGIFGSTLDWLSIPQVGPGINSGHVGV